MRRWLAALALLAGMMTARAQARPPSQPSTPGSEQTVQTPGAAQSVQTPNATQATPLPNAYFGGIVPSQPPAVSSFSQSGGTVTVVSQSTAGVVISSIPLGPQVFLPAEMR
jgi:hypothetical protein